MIKTLDSNQSDEIVNAVKGVITEVNSGVSPNDAFVKVVKSSKFNPEIVNRMIEAFNQSKAVKQLDEPPEKRAAHFELADPHIIFSSVYSSQDNDVSGAYIPDETSTHDFLNKKSHAQLLVYQGAPDYDYSEITVANKVLSKVAAAKVALKDLEVDEAKHTRMMTEFIKMAAAEIRKANHEPYDGFERRVQRAYGDKGEKLVNLVYKFANIKRVAVKYEKQASFILPTRSPYIEASQAITEAERLINVREKRASAEVIVSSNTRLLKRSDYLTDAVKSVIPTESGDTGPSVTITPEDKDYQAEMKSIELKATIADLMRNDPQIGAYPIDQVIKATNAAISVAPTAMMNPATLRAALHRTLVDHSMSADEALNYMTTDTDIRDKSNRANLTRQTLLGKIQ